MIMVVVVVVGVLPGKSGLFLAIVLLAPDISIVFSSRGCTVVYGREKREMPSDDVYIYLYLSMKYQIVSEFMCCC